jgi:endonuclease YncB( thermonuclease family)
MFGWRRRSEGFEWREYVRTTVLVRRADRQKKVDEVRDAAVAKVKDTKDRGVAAGRATAEVASNHLAQWARLIWRSVQQFSAAAARKCVAWARSAGALIAERFPTVRLPTWSWPAAAGAPLQRIGLLLPDVGRFKFPVDRNWLVGGAIAVCLVLVGGPMLGSSQGPSTARLGPQTLALSSSGELSGRATAVSGELLRVDGTLVRLSGVEAPEAKQPCYKSSGRRWSCGQSARSALEKALRGRSVSCTPSGHSDDGAMLASCRINGADVAEGLVRGGHVFATSGFLASYRTAEADAQAAGAGLWQGETIRPKEWRDQIWQEAKRAAPEGCPIKGYVRASDRTYAMPWTHGYEGAKVRTVRGDRWFCTEEEARAAGFKSANRS